MDLDLATFCNVLEFREFFEALPLKQRQIQLKILIRHCREYSAIDFEVTNQKIAKTLAIATGLTARHVLRVIKQQAH